MVNDHHAAVRAFIEGLGQVGLDLVTAVTGDRDGLCFQVVVMGRDYPASISSVTEVLCGG